MDVDRPGRLPDPAASATAASRKRIGLQTDSDSEGTHIYSLSSEDPSDDEGFELVRSRKAKRRNTRSSSSSSTQTVEPMRNSDANTILFMPVIPTGNMKRLNRQSVSMLPETVVPNEITDIRVNTRKNVLAVDVQHAGALSALRKVTDLDGMQVRSHIPLGSDVITGVIYDVDLAILNNDLPILVKAASDRDVIVDVYRLGNSRCVKIVFKGNGLPSHVKVGHFRHPVRPFIPKPLQCRKCMKIGHVSSVCENETVCPRCAEPHAADKCAATVMKCPNCHGSHEATSKDCPKIKTEMAILKEMARDHSSHREAAAKIRKRRSRRRHSSKKASASVMRMPCPQSPPPLPPRPLTSERPTKDKGTGKHTDTEAWPALPKRQPPAESLHADGSRPSRASPAGELTEQDRQVVTMVRSLMNTIRMLLKKLQTPTAESTLQILDALNPVLASLL